MPESNPYPPGVTNESRFPDSYSRPFGVTLLVFGVLIIAGLNLVRLSQAIAQRQFIAELIPGLSYYLAGSGLLWTLVGLSLAWGLWLGRSWAGRAAPWSALAYTTYDWLDRLLLRKGASLTGWPFMVCVSALILGYVIFTLSRPKVKAFFHL